MKTREKIYKELFASQRVELSIINNLEKEYSKITKATNLINSEGKKLDREIFNFRDVWNVDATKLISLIGDYKKMAKELGINTDDKFEKALNDLSEAKNTFSYLVGR